MKTLACLCAVVLLAGLVGCDKPGAFSKEIALVNSKAVDQCKGFKWKAKRMEKYQGRVAVWFGSWGFLVKGDVVCAVNGASRSCADVPDCADATGDPAELFRTDTATRSPSVMPDRPAAKATKPTSGNWYELAKVTETLCEAIQVAKPELTDEGHGLRMLIAWMSINTLTWAELNSVGKTTYQEVMKKPDQERGRVLCAEGTIDSLQPIPEGQGTQQGELVLDRGAGVVRFMTDQSTKGLAERKRGKFCGIVLGANSYTSDAGRKIRYADTVGMFDIDENTAMPSCEVLCSTARVCGFPWSWSEADFCPGTCKRDGGRSMLATCVGRMTTRLKATARSIERIRKAGTSVSPEIAESMNGCPQFRKCVEVTGGIQNRVAAWLKSEELAGRSAVARKDLDRNGVCRFVEPPSKPGAK